MMEAVFGSVAAQCVLLYLQNYSEGYARGIADKFDMGASQVFKQLRKFEDGGLLMSRAIGKTRVYYWNEQNHLVTDLRSLLQSLLESLPEAEVNRYYRDST
ncbi:MAG: ArsR family transcriptional regulator [Gammaproteobacteria bacterium]|nr:ArsR family transcriptional regulator [Gammaproteobacteria bacterium]MCZ6855613.1 ArsR family transcriptional regulator [Gammaproteobacteria bacterium]